MKTVYRFNNKVLKNIANDKWLVNKVDPYNPLNLPPNTVRVRTSDGNVPRKAGYATYETATLVPGTTDVYDVYKSGTSFQSLLESSFNVIEVLGANTTGITDMTNMFNTCTALTTVVLFDTTNVTNMKMMFFNCVALTTVALFNTHNVVDTSYMFSECENLPIVPLFDTYNVTDMSAMFYKCYKVQSGALALYLQASSQSTVPSSHSLVFTDCGKNTQTGSAELAQIPSDWK